MASIDARIEQLSRIKWLASSFRMVWWLIPVATWGITYFTGVTSSMETAQVIALSLLSLASTVVLLNQLSVFFGQPVLMAFAYDYAYAVSVLNVNMGFEPWNEAGTLEIGVLLSNSARHPVRYKVDRFDVRIHDRVLTSKNFVNEGGIISTGTSSTFTHPAFPKATISEFLEKKVEGEVEIHLVYGHPDRPPARRLIRKMAITLNLLTAAPGISNLTLSHSDTPI